MHVCQLSMCLEKLKFDRIMPVLQNNIGSWLMCINRAMDALRKLLINTEARVTQGNSLLRFSLAERPDPHAFITQRMHTNHEPIIVKILP